MAAASNSKTSSSSSAPSKEYRCTICGRIFDSAETLSSHKRMDHSQQGYQPPAGVG
ncbi:MAG TPA: C2H2-type zinc finger protein [Nitrososphaeraceae archaeon]|nr:C2H2-type zinc finger protein [Nitrososphaeraceae archaeon]